MGKHIVRQGECIETIAARHGHDPAKLWSANAGLHEQRKSLHVLAPGDEIELPEVERKTFQLPTEQIHRLRVQRPKARLIVRFFVDDEPRADEQYTLAYRGTEITGTTDGDGVLDEPVPFDLDRATVRFARWGEPPPLWRPEPFAGVNDSDLEHEDGDPEAENAALEAEDAEQPTEDIYVFDLRHLDPSAEVTGAQGRLHGLGFPVGRIDGELGPRTADALRSYQAEHGLEPTGELDDPTRAKLSEHVEG